MAIRELVRSRVSLVTRHRIAEWRVRARRPTARWRSLPRALIIGAQRSGTSSLHRHLGDHPGVAAPRRKEVEYFSRRYFANGEPWYRAHFALDGGRHLGFDATPDYLFHPLAAERAAALLPGARLVVLLRDPVERAWSHFHHMTALGYETLDIHAALDAEEARSAPDLARLAVDPLHDARDLLRTSYVARGHYADQLRRWLDEYPRESLLVVRSEDFFAEPRRQFARVLDHLDLDPWHPPTFDNVTRPASGAPGPGPAPADVRARLEPLFADEPQRLVDLLGDAAPRW